MTSPALRAEEEVGNRNHEGFDTYGIAFMARGEVIISTGCFHISIRGKTRPTEGDFSDFFWGFVGLVQVLTSCLLATYGASRRTPKFVKGKKWEEARPHLKRVPTKTSTLSS